MTRITNPSDWHRRMRGEIIGAGLTLDENSDAVIQLVEAEIVKLQAHLKEADELLEIAYYAHQKAGLEGQGNRGLPHELRMFAMHFSQPETPKTPEHVILKGDGRYWRFRRRDRVPEEAAAGDPTP